MGDNRLLSERDLWFSPSQMKEGAKNALMYPLRHPEQTAEFGLSVAPGSGEAMSARDAWNASGRAGNALLSGDFGQAASEYGNVATGILGAIPGAGIIARGTKRGAAWMDQNLPAGVNKLLDSMTPQASQDTLYAIPAWHGSPHDFDEFKLDKIGTGEGAQVYGHGLYFAESPDVAKSYQRALAGKGMSMDSLAKEFPELGALDADALAAIYRKAGTETEPIKAARQVQMAVPSLRDNGSFMDGAPPTEHQKRIAALIERARDAGRGRIYRTELDVEPEDLLDWDLPLSQQSEKVKGALEGAFGGPLSDNLTGQDLLTRLQLTRRIEPTDMSAKLREAGIPGIRYLDQGSRGAGEGSRNFVIFDDRLVKILGKE